MLPIDSCSPPKLKKCLAWDVPITNTPGSRPAVAAPGNSPSRTREEEGPAPETVSCCQRSAEIPLRGRCHAAVDCMADPRGIKFTPIIELGRDAIDYIPVRLNKLPGLGLELAYETEKRFPVVPPSIEQRDPANAPPVRLLWRDGPIHDVLR